MTNGATPANVNVDIGGWLTSAWEYFVEDAIAWVLMALIFVGAFLVLGNIPILGQVALLALTGPLEGGLFYAAFMRMRGTPVTVGMLFGPLQTDFVPLMLVGAVVSVLTGIITVFTCGIGILIALPMWMFAIPLVLERKLGFWDAMELSRQTVWSNLMQWILFGLVVLVITLAGTLVVGIGVLVTMPLGFLMVALAYRDVFGLQAIGDAPVAGPVPMEPAPEPETDTTGGEPGA